jgi:glycosyltransferase involved in cell wall biosynthesis
MIKFSIILPIYNVDKFLQDSLESLLCQDISEKEYEIICVNDGSSDSSANIVRRYMENHSNIILIEQKNAGVSAARNKGFDMASGEYVWFVDPDDMITSNCLGKIYSEMKKADAQIFELEYRTCEESSRFSQEIIDFKIDGENKPGSSGSGWLSVCLSDYLRENHILWNEKLNYGEDYLWAFQTKYRKHNSIYTNTALYIYRQRQDSAMHAHDPNKTRKHMEDMVELRLSYGKEYKRLAAENLDTGIYQEIRRRQQLCSESAMFNLMKLRLPAKQLNLEINKLCDAGVYPYGYLTWNFMCEKPINPLKYRVFTFLFSFEPYYRFICMLYRRVRR